MTSYTLFSQGAVGSGVASDANPYTLGVQFSVSESCTLDGIWFYSAASAAALPQTIALYEVSGQSLVHSESASWSGLAGSGWVFASFSSAPSLTASTAYEACVLQNTSVNWYPETGNYWSSGAGSGGITNGPLSAPNSSSATLGQDLFHSGGTLAYPTSNGSGAYNFWLDPQVTPSGGTAHTATASLTVTPSFTAARTRGRNRAASLTVTPSFTAARTRGRNRTASLLVVPAFSAARQVAHVRTGSLLVVPSFTAVPSGGSTPAAAPATGGWWQLHSILKYAEQEFDFYASRPPMACPRDGEPLRKAPPADSGSDCELYCMFCGFEYPRDWQRPFRPG